MRKLCANLFARINRDGLRLFESVVNTLGGPASAPESEIIPLSKNYPFILTPQKFFELLEYLCGTYESILHESVLILKNAEIFDKTKRFRELLRDYQKTGSVF
ncbi:MAG: hypothetical protein NZT61_02435 [Deltaproteobacteria bacterium]|nr:hypothetical protein [Deltaproteobacteria bacterium]MCX7952661.1 hypothetical protein [Deltaproteobacteria bacterium]